MKKLCMLTLAAAALALGLAAAPDVPDHPSKLTFEPLTYNPPQPADYRHELPNGMVVYIIEDRLLPLLDVGAVIRTGSLWDPPGKEGLAAMAGEVMRTGGTKSVAADDLDERLAFLGARLSTSVGGTSGRASLSMLVKDAGEGLKLMADVLMNPAFEESKIALYKDRALHDLKTKNDNPRGVLEREFDKLLYGSHPSVREETAASIEGIARGDLIAFHDAYFAPNNIILCVAGDFEKDAMLKKIEAVFAGWPRKEMDLPPIPEVEVRNRPGVFLIQKDINQGYINLGHFGIKDTNPDVYAIDVMNFILGGGSFTSRITTKVRSDEGLAYNTGCRFANRHLFPGTFYGYVQTKSTTVPYAIRLILEEFELIRSEEVTDEEMETAKSYFKDSFPNRFTSSIRTMEAFADLEYDGFPMDYFDAYRDRIDAVTKADVLRVAKKYVKPGEMTILVVGDIEACSAGDEKHPGTLADLGPVSVIELKDPLTGE